MIKMVIFDPSGQCELCLGLDEKAEIQILKGI